ncbi:MAG: hypothetical protein AAF554_09005 [Bacteroidota bacterium]
MKTEYNNIDKPSLLYTVIEEMVFLEETKKLASYLLRKLEVLQVKFQKRYNGFINREWTKASLILAGYMSFSSLLMFVAYKMVTIL